LDALSGIAGSMNVMSVAVVDKDGSRFAMKK
jgi:hypothetical protein